jgi:hypothetical protein
VKILVSTAILLSLAVSGCSGQSNIQSESIGNPSDPPSAGSNRSVDLQIQPVTDPELTKFFSKQVDIFGLEILATKDTPNNKIAHAAAVAAEYLDNNQNGEVDDPAILQSLTEERATLVMGPDEEAFIQLDPLAADALDGRLLQDLYAEETNPGDGAFDASLEEIHHLILNGGWAKVYPDALGQQKGTQIAASMDVARGGYFENVPNDYPKEAWY